MKVLLIGKAKMHASRGECKDAGGRAMQEQFAEFTGVNDRLSTFSTRSLSQMAFVEMS